MKLVLLVTFSFLASTCNAAFCHWNSGCPYKYFSTKTSYNAIRGDIRDSIVKSRGELFVFNHALSNNTSISFFSVQDVNLSASGVYSGMVKDIPLSNLAKKWRMLLPLGTM